MAAEGSRDGRDAAGIDVRTVHVGETVRQQDVRTVPAVEVVLVRWPAEATRRARLADEQQPRLLLVEGDVAPPEVTDCLEDWLRVPVDDAELSARLAGLSARARRHAAPERPVLDDDGVLRVGSSWVSLPPVEARLTAALLVRLGTVVSREALSRAGWPDGAPGRNALDVHVLRLRRRLGAVGLVIRTVRSRGYLMEQDSEKGQASVALA
jgi:DNA-binding response OmpR family regulator